MARGHSHEHYRKEIATWKVTTSAAGAKKSAGKRGTRTTAATAIRGGAPKASTKASIRAVPSAAGSIMSGTTAGPTSGKRGTGSNAMTKATNASASRPIGRARARSRGIRTIRITRATESALVGVSRATTTIQTGRTTAARATGTSSARAAATFNAGVRTR